MTERAWLTVDTLLDIERALEERFAGRKVKVEWDDRHGQYVVTVSNRNGGNAAVAGLYPSMTALAESLNVPTGRRS